MPRGLSFLNHAYPCDSETSTYVHVFQIIVRFTRMNHISRLGKWIIQQLISMLALSVIVPCYNEERTLEACIRRVLEIKDDLLSLEIIIVDDCSKDGSLKVAQELSNRYTEVRVLRHEKNRRLISADANSVTFKVRITASRGQAATQP